MDNNKYYEERPDTNDPYTDSNGSGTGTENNPYQYESPDNNRPPMRPKANPMAISAFIVSILSFVLCCCSPNFLMIGAIVAIGLAICSKIFYKGTPMHPLAIAAIVIAVVAIILIICMLILSFIWFPQYLKSNPELFNEMKEFFSQYGVDVSSSFYY